MGAVASMGDRQVVVVGGGPTGLVLAGELALAGVDVAIVERRPDQGLDGSRAGGLHARSLEVLDQRGVVERFLDEGRPSPSLLFAMAPVDLSDLPSRHACVLGLWQRHIERLLAGWVLDELAVPILRSRQVTGVAPDADGVDVALADGTGIRADYVVGCDGGRSTVRSAVGIDVAGWDATTSWTIAEVEMATTPEIGVRPEGGGIGPADGGDAYRVVLVDDEVRHGEPTLDDVRASLVAAYGTDFGADRPRWISRFTDAARQAVAYRSGRVLLAGDAAHVHPPQGGQGLNTGIQDAVNLGWKLAQVAHGTAPDALLDTYHEERHPVGARVLQTALAQVAAATPGIRHEALRAAIGELLAGDDARRIVAARISGLDIRYDLGGDHPLVGRRMPDLALEGPDGRSRVAVLLREARPLLLDLVGAGSDRDELAPWAHRIRRVSASTDERWELPVVGEVDPPDAVLVRPDGHVAWVGGLGDPELPVVLARWFGPGAGP